jgi:hypothetical protein
LVETLAAEFPEVPILVTLDRLALDSVADNVTAELVPIGYLAVLLSIFI